MKPGHRTTEFWLNLASLLFTAVLAVLSSTGVISDTSPLYGLATSLGSGLYAVARGLAKAQPSPVVAPVAAGPWGTVTQPATVNPVAVAPASPSSDAPTPPSVVGVPPLAAA